VTYRNIGDVYARLGRAAEAHHSYEGAIAAAAERLKINPSDAGTIALVALCEAKIGRTGAAERHAAEALALAPKDRNVLVKNAEVYTRLKRDDRALQYVRDAVALGYDAASARRNHEFATLKNHPGFEPALAAAPAPHR
jgi:tetratricopeptide (TPR) repeat protein